MKKLLPTTMVVAFMLFSASVSAQLNGTYTIGGTSPSYVTFSTALTALSTSGISGPVTFNVRPGTYNEVITLDSVPGASPTNRITFQSETGVSSDVTITAESYFSQGGYYNPIFVFNDAKYYTLNNLTVTYSTRFSYSYIYVFLMQLVYGSANDSINHCILNGLSDGSGVSDNYVIWDQSYNSNLVLNGCELNGGAYGYAADYGAIPGPSIVNDTFTGQNYGGMNFYNCNNVLLQGNVINANQYSNTAFIGIEMDKCANAVIVGNKLLNSYGYGFWFNNPSVGPGILASVGFMANNYIESQYGIKGAGVDSFSIYNNTLRTTVQGISLTSGSGNKLLDNIFDNSGTGSSNIFNLASATNFNESDYNDFYSTGLLARIAGTYSNLAAWQTGTGFDAHSRSVLPPFVSGTDYHLTTCDSLKFGLALGVIYDIDSDIRSTITPVVGAYECPATGITAQFTASNDSICQGGAVTFTDKSTDSPTSWHWVFTGGTPGTSNSQNPSVNYDTAGTFTVKLVATNSTSADSITKTGYITINAMPITGVVTASPDSVCVGSSSQLTATGSSGIIQWQSSPTGSSYSNISGANSSIYNTPPLSQSVKYRLVVSNGVCADTSAPVAVTVNPPPAPPVLSVSDSIICSNDSARIQTSGSYASYLWNDGDTTSYTWANSAGAYWVTVTDANGCTAVSGEQNIYVYPVPGDEIIEEGDTLSSYGGVSYQWYFNDTVIPGATGAVYVVHETGYYSVQVTDTNGCTYRTSDVYITITGIVGEDINSMVSIYPTPFTNIVFIKWDATISIGSIEIYDVLGERVIKKEATGFYIGPLPMDVSVLPAGVYVVVARTNMHIEYVKRMVKE